MPDVFLADHQGAGGRDAERPEAAGTVHCRGSQFHAQEQGNGGQVSLAGTLPFLHS